MLLTVRLSGLRSVLVLWLTAICGFVAVAAIHVALGFNWVTGLLALRVRYYQGIASQRPFSYFVFADLAAWLVSCSPLLAIGVVRALVVLSKGRAGPWTQDRIVSLLALSGVLAAALARMYRSSLWRWWRHLRSGAVEATSDYAGVKGGATSSHRHRQARK